jgi:hypothetical protein
MNLKKEIIAKHKGRGNSWLKIPKDSVFYKEIVDKLKDETNGVLLSHFEREGFGWVRFSKINKDNSVKYEIRHNGCKIDHPDFYYNFHINDIINFEILRSTPLKLDLEKYPEDRVLKVKKEKKEKQNKNSFLLKKEDIKENEAVCLLPKDNSTKIQLEIFEKWCKLNNIMSDE